MKDKSSKEEEGKYTKIGTVVGVIALIITVWQIWPTSKPNLDGEWKLTTEVTQSNYSAYIGKKIEWKMFLSENQNIIKGTAEKIKIDGQELESKNKTCLQLEGSLKGENIVLSISENGKLRTTTGIIQAKVVSDIIEGQFSQTAANSMGKVLAEKVK